MIACALLDSINTVKIVKITLSSLYANTARTIEDALGEAIREASRAGKAILYIPDFCSLWDALPETSQRLLFSIISSIPENQPTFLGNLKI